MDRKHAPTIHCARKTKRLTQPVDLKIQALKYTEIDCFSFRQVRKPLITISPYCQNCVLVLSKIHFITRGERTLSLALYHAVSLRSFARTHIHVSIYIRAGS